MTTDVKTGISQMSIEHKYDIIHTDKNYEQESAIIAGIIGSKLTLLDVACGTGNHLTHLSKIYDCYGIDINQKMIDIAKLKGLNVHCDDMRSFKIDKKFDAITCLFGSIAHLLSYQDLCNALVCFKEHLNVGGVILLEPWVFLNQYIPRTISRQISDNVRVTSKNTLSGNIATLEKTYLIYGEEFSTTIDICCFTEDEYLSAIDAAGLNLEKLNINLDLVNGLYLLKC